MPNQVFRDSSGRFFLVTSASTERVTIRYGTGETYTMDRDIWQAYPKKPIARLIATS